VTIAIIFYILAVALIFGGLIGIFLPVVPGIPVIFIGMLILAYLSKFSLVSVTAVVILGVLATLSVASDYLSGTIGAKYSGAGILGIAGAIIGAVFGVSVMGPIGLILGPAIGVFIFEMLARKPIKKSARSAGFTLFSTTLGIIFNIVLALTMLIIFISALFV